MPSRKSLSRRERRRILGDYAFLAPQLVLYLGLSILPFFVAVPIVLTDRVSFVDVDVEYIGFANLTRLFTDTNLSSEFLPALRRSLVFVALNYVAVYVFGLTLALMMYETGFRGGFFTVIYLPMMVSGLAFGYLAVMLFARSTGTVNLLLMRLRWIKEPIDIKRSSGVTILLPLLVGWRYAGFNMAIFLAGLMTIPTETIEAATVDGASYWQKLLRVYFPQMMPAFIIATTFCFIGSFSVFDELVALGALYGNKQAELLSIALFKYGFLSKRLSQGMALALETGLPLSIVGILLQRLQRRLQY